MKISKCFFCNNLKSTPYNVTEIEPNQTICTFFMCEKCGIEYIDSLNKKENQMDSNENVFDLTKITSPEDILNFIENMSLIPNSDTKSTPCECGWTEEDLHKFGRIGCSKCYQHMSDSIKKMLLLFHGRTDHNGKAPKEWKNSSIEKLKILKLQYAKALELEEYEKLREIKMKIDEFNL
jgi:protein arginine kinase activator